MRLRSIAASTSAPPTFRIIEAMAQMVTRPNPAVNSSSPTSRM